MTVQKARHGPGATPEREHATATAQTKAPTAGRGPRRSSPGLRPALCALLLIVAAGLGLAAWRHGAAGSLAHNSSLRPGGGALIGGPFRLVDQGGHAVDQRLLLGKWSAVFFGYTYCPDSCPATLQALTAASRRLGGHAKDFQVVFISVDPARDTPAQMKLYLSSQALPQGTLGLTGTPAEVADVARAYRVYYAKAGSGPDYQVQHSAAIYLMDPRGSFLEPLDEAQPPAAMAAQIGQAMARG